MSPSSPTTLKGRDSVSGTARLNARRIGSAISANKTEGDDLTRARLFCLAARSEMAALIEADRSSPTERLSRGRDPVWICERLDTIQRHAKRARARAVYRSAQDVMALIERRNDHMPIDWTRVDGRLFVLNKLLGQYEDGLQEIAPASDLPDMAPAPAGRTHYETQAVIARNTLTSLLPHASADERAGLSRLMDIDLSAPSGDPVASDEWTTSNAVIATDHATEADDMNVEPVDFMLPVLMQRLLGVGQQYGKVLSLSHALDDVWIAKSARPDVETLLFERLSDLIASALPLQGVGRLDIGHAETGFSIQGSGFEAFTLDLPDGTLCAPPTLNDTQPDDARLIPAPRITDETEGDLRAQLAALMDGALIGDVQLDTPTDENTGPSGDTEGGAQ